MDVGESIGQGGLSVSAAVLGARPGRRFKWIVFPAKRVDHAGNIDDVDDSVNGGGIDVGTGLVHRAGLISKHVERGHGICSDVHSAVRQDPLTTLDIEGPGVIAPDCGCQRP